MKQQSCHIRQQWHSNRPSGHFRTLTLLHWCTTFGTPIMVEVVLFFLLSTMMGAYHIDEGCFRALPANWLIAYLLFSRYSCVHWRPASSLLSARSMAAVT